MEALIVIGLLFVGLGMVVVVLNDSQFVRFLCYLVGLLGVLFMTLGISQKVDEIRPSAMDVYQGKTTLQYTYVDSVKVDSIVVFKERK
ncbi:MAG: hypothetical protein IJ669_01290 [Prevotella sp.]|nr:hypothetical protein [Prevotella sp.]